MPEIDEAVLKNSLPKSAMSVRFLRAQHTQEVMFTHQISLPQPLIVWWPVLVGLLVLYVPTFSDLSKTLWNQDEHIHEPMVLMATLWMFWRKRTVWLPPEHGVDTLGGSLLLGFGLLLYALGRSQEILIFEIGSQIPVLAGVLLMTKGSPAVRTCWFPLLFIVFMLPLPGFLVDAMTGPLKQQVSAWAECLLYAIGYPIARSGVVLTIGPYQLLVAQACSGLNSMISLSAMGTLYLYLIQDRLWLKSLLLVLAILPIAFVANVVRVIALVLVTYHFGDDAGQGFFHGFAGIVLFAAALTGLFLLDSVLTVLARTVRAN